VRQENQHSALKSKTSFSHAFKSFPAYFFFLLLRCIGLLQKLLNLLRGFFKREKKLSLGFYGPVNAGKSTLANRFCRDFVGCELSAVSEVPHETRSVQQKQGVVMRVNGKSLVVDVVDLPGVASKIDYREFQAWGLEKEAAQQRAKEAAKGVVEAIKWLDEVDAALVVMDSTRDPVTQVNLALLSNIEARGIPVIIVANKVDDDKARVDKICEAFPNHTVLGVSALTGENMPKLYEAIAEKF
jgi:small GTP-binding protein